MARLQEIFFERGVIELLHESRPAKVASAPACVLANGANRGVVQFLADRNVLAGFPQPKPMSAGRQPDSFVATIHVCVVAHERRVQPAVRMSSTTPRQPSAAAWSMLLAWAISLVSQHPSGCLAIPPLRAGGAGRLERCPPSRRAALAPRATELLRHRR